MFPQTLEDKAAQLIEHATKHGIKIATAESCTGGLVSALITEIPGSSAVFEYGFITYANRAKNEILTVPHYFLEEFGAVSAQTAIAMAESAQLLSRADIAVAITGVAGPGGGSDTKPVGTVFVGVAQKGVETEFLHLKLEGTRQHIRLATVEAAIDGLLARCKKKERAKEQA